MSKQDFVAFLLIGFGLTAASMDARAAHSTKCPSGASFDLQFRALEKSEDGTRQQLHASFALTNTGTGERWFGLQDDLLLPVLDNSRAILQSRARGSSDDWRMWGLLAHFFEIRKWLVLGPEAAGLVDVDISTVTAAEKEFRVFLRDKDGCEAYSDAFRLDGH